MTEPLNDQPPASELDEVLAFAVAASRRADVPDAVLQAALGRIVLRAPDVSPSANQGVRRRLMLLATSAAAVLVVLAFLLGGAPAAGAEPILLTVMGLQAQPAVSAPVAGGLRTLLMVHVFAILGAYLAVILSWAAASLPPVLSLFNARPPRFCRAAILTSVWLLPIAAGLESLGIVLGCLWARSALGRFWDWDVREIEALLLVVVVLAWFFLARRWLSQGLLVAGLAAGGFWIVVALRWLTVVLQTHSYGFPPWQGPLAVTACVVLLNALLLAASHVLARRAA